MHTPGAQVSTSMHPAAKMCLYSCATAACSLVLVWEMFSDWLATKHAQSLWILSEAA